jgi:hypothetical protein
MQNWKRAAIASAAAASVALFMRGRRPAGVLAAGVGLAVLASEYPEKFDQVRKEIPRYVDRAGGFLEVVSRVGGRLAEFAEDRGRGIWEELKSY